MNAVTLRDLKSANPFRAEADEDMPATSGALARTDQVRAVAEVQAALAIARANPRDPVDAVDRLLNACTRPSLAEVAVYQYSRGGTDISGPSIRLAEAAAQCWGNLQFGIRELEQRAGESVVQAYAWDVETNTRREMTFSVPHKRHTRGGDYALTDPRDIYEMVANQGARRLRACILSVIPGDVIEAAVGQCEVTLKAKADTGPEAMAKMLEAFRAYNVTRAQIETRIQRRLDAITPAQVVSLKKIYASLRDGMSSAADWFGADISTGSQQKQSDVEPQEEIAQTKWPAPITDPETGEQGWEDSTGTYYDPARHGWNTKESRPSVTAEGVFRARRGTAGAQPAAVDEASKDRTDPGQDQPAPGIDLE